MHRLRLLVLFLAAFTATRFAQADTIEFTATIISQNGLYAVPIGSTYTGFIHYAGYFDSNSPVAPPPVDSYGFSYPTAPAAIDGLLWDFVERYMLGSPLQAGVAYVDFSSPAASFLVNGPLFTIFTPTYLTSPSPGYYSFGYSQWESGTVTYTYLSDPPVSSTPEPASFFLVGSAAIAAFGLERRRRAVLQS